MISVLKYLLAVADEQIIMPPRIYRPLHVGLQGDTLCLWVMVDTDEPPEDVKVRIFGTGQSVTVPHPIRDYVGTVRVGQFVWHVFVEQGGRMG